MSRRLLDTDTCVWILRHRTHTVEQLAALSPDDVSVSTVNEAELLFGALLSQDPERSRAAVVAFLEPIERIPFDSAAAESYAAARQALRRQPIGERDLLVVAIALSRGFTLVTHNTRELSRVAGLELEDWY